MWSTTRGTRTKTTGHALHRHVPDSPALDKPGRHPPLSRPRSPKIVSPYRATRSRPSPTHAPPMFNHVPTPAQFLPTIPPSPGNLVKALETYAHPCYPRLREGPTPRPEALPLVVGKAPGDSENKAGRPVRPLSCSAKRRDVSAPNRALRQNRMAQEQRRPQLRIHQNATERNSSRLHRTRAPAVTWYNPCRPPRFHRR